MLAVLKFLLCLKTVVCAKILAIYPTPSISHQIVFRPLTEKLLTLGHQVIVVTPMPMRKKHENLTELNIDGAEEIWDRRLKYNSYLGKKDAILPQYAFFMKCQVRIAKAEIENEKIQQLMNQKFDLILAEAWQRHTLIYSHLINAPTIFISSISTIGDEESLLGNVNHVFLYPKPVQQRLYNLNLWEKLQEFYKRAVINRIWSMFADEEMELYRNKFGDVPSYGELYNKVDMMFLNTHPIWINNQPMPPNVINIWGIYRTPRNELPKDLKNYLDSSTNGVIYISFGSNVISSTLSSEIVNLYIRVVSKLPYDVIWKWESEEMIDQPKNVKISKWVPQTDLLAHPKVKLFITQGGFQSTDEAINAGVPLLGIPMLGDQWFNIEKYEHFGIGKKVDLETITEEKLETAILSVINDTSYKTNVNRLKVLMNDQQNSGLDRATWWVEYVLQNRGCHLKPRSILPMYEYYEVELVLCVMCILVVIMLCVLLCVYGIYCVFKYYGVKL